MASEQGEHPHLHQPLSPAFDRDTHEAEPLLPGEHQQSTESTSALFSKLSTTQKRRIRGAFIFLWAFLATVTVIVLAVFLQHFSHNRLDHGNDHDHMHPPGHGPPDFNSPPSQKRNLIFLVSDGMGPAALSMTRSFMQLTTDSPFNQTLILDSLLIGQSRTLSSSSLITDSAAGATAFSCGHKSYNGAISVLPDGTPCPSVMEAAKLAGYMTGVVVTTDVTDATPACFGSHVLGRGMQDGIALQMLGLEGVNGTNRGSRGRSLDLILGGGRCRFIGNGKEGSCRFDERDVVEEAKGLDWSFIDTKEDLAKMNETDIPLLGLFAPTDIPFEIDRRFVAEQFPSLQEMVKKALHIMKEATKDSEHGFFLMIEGSRIDHAAHWNDPAAQVHEVLAYDNAIKSILEFIDEEDTSTLLVSTSDHDTGGLAVGRQLSLTYPEYRWYPTVLSNVTHSAEWVSVQYHKYLLDSPSKKSSTKLKQYLQDLVRSNLGFDLTRSEVMALIEQPIFAGWLLSDMISRRTQVGWSTHGHTAVDVNIYSSVSRQRKTLTNNHDTRSEEQSPFTVKQDKEEKRKDWIWEEGVRRMISGNRENTDVGKTLSWWLNVESQMEMIGKELRAEAGLSNGNSKVKSEQTVVKSDNKPWTDAKLLRQYEVWSKSQTWE